MHITHMKVYFINWYLPIAMINGIDERSIDFPWLPAYSKGGQGIVFDKSIIYKFKQSKAANYKADSTPVSRNQLYLKF